MRDQFNLTGDFKGAVVNIQSVLDRTGVAARNVPLNEDEVSRLADLVSKLRAEVIELGREHEQAAALVARAADNLVSEATSHQVDVPRLKRAGEMLKSTAEFLGRVGPGLVITIGEVITLIFGK